jgi:predicted membrane protein
LLKRPRGAGYVPFAYNQFDGFRNIGTGSIILALLALAFLVQCIVNLHFTMLPIPLAVLYVIFRFPLGLPYIRTGTLIAASVLAAAGLSVLFPRRHCHGRKFRRYNQDGNHPQARVEDGGNDNTPFISVSFGAVSRHISADCLETARLNCHFGALDLFFDQAELSPKGAELILNCNFGAISLYVPKHWRIIDRLNCSLGGVNIDKRSTMLEENAPQLTLSGSVSLGGVEIRYL